MSKQMDGRAQMPDIVQPDFEVAVIGSGFSGLGMAIKLKQAGIQAFVVLEKAHQVGGTWRENTYPGCACDVPSHMYSFSHERKPDWSRMYSGQPEILDYLKHCVEKHELLPHIRFGAEVSEAVFDEARHLWTVRTADGKSFTARVVVSAMGPLHRPSIPALAGIEQFEGAVFHSAQWNHACDLAGKRIAVIGTGASAIQFVPEIAPNAARLVLFQRTPAWVLPRKDRPIEKREQAIYRRVPGAIGFLRNLIYWQLEFRALAFLKPTLMRFVEKMGIRHLEQQIADPQLRAKLTPTYTIGCKRILMSNDYYPALARPNVDVVTDPIAEVTQHGIVTRNGTEYPADVIIYGTGFNATDLLGKVRYLGCNGVDLNAVWRDAPEAYLGVAAAGFPNLFVLLGPNTGLGHNSVVFMAEQQIDYVMQCLRLMREQKAASMEVLPEVQTEFNQAIQQRLQKTVWASGCRSWYQNADGKNVTLWPGFTFQYWSRMKKVRLGDYRLSEIKASMRDEFR